MKTKGRFLGHALHPMLIVFPLGLLSTAVVFEAIYYLTGDRTYATVTYYMILAGLIGGAAAALFGWIDWSSIPANTRAKSVGLMHGLANGVVMLLFAVSWYLRMGGTHEPSVVATALAGLAFVLSLVGGWLGGELVERLGISVHEGANPDAPNSLKTESTQPEHGTATASNVRNLRKV